MPIRWEGGSAKLRIIKVMLVICFLKESGPDQGRGVGGKLLQPVLQRADASRTACYLETEAERNLAFYERHGFRVVAEASVPGLDVQTWSLVREPLPDG